MWASENKQRRNGERMERALKVGNINMKEKEGEKRKEYLVNKMKASRG